MASVVESSRGGVNFFSLLPEEVLVHLIGGITGKAYLDGRAFIALRRCCKRFDTLYGQHSSAWFKSWTESYEWYFGNSDFWLSSECEKVYVKCVENKSLSVGYFGGSIRDRTGVSQVCSSFRIANRDDAVEGQASYRLSEDRKVDLSIARSALACAYDWKAEEIFVIGGWTGSREAVANVEIFDANSFDLKGDGAALKLPRCFLSAAFDSSLHHVFAFGGADSLFQGADVYDSGEYFLNVDGGRKWRLVPAKMKTRRAGHAAAYDSRRNRMYQVGGYGGDTLYHDSMEWVDLTPQRLASVNDGFVQCESNMSVKRTGVGAGFGPDGCIYAVGGSPDGGVGHKSLERYDPREGSWQLLAPMTYEKGYTSAAFGPDGKFWAAGGSTVEMLGGFVAETYSDHFEVYDPRNNTWEVLSEKLHMAIADLALISWFQG